MMSGFAYMQDQDNNWNGNQQYWPNANQGYWQPYQYAQPNYSWPPQDREPSLKDIMDQLDQMVQAQLVQTTEQLNQLEQQNKKIMEEAAADTKKLKLQIEKFLEAENENEHEEFPIDMTNLELEELKAEMLRSEMELEERGEVYRFPGPITSARSVHNERSYELLQEGSETEAFTSAREARSERSCEHNPVTETFTSARMEASERSYGGCSLGFDTLKSADVWRQIDEHVYELQDEEYKSSYEQTEDESSEHEILIEHDEKWDAIGMGAFDADSHSDSWFDSDEEEEDKVREFVTRLDERSIQNFQPAIVTDVFDEEPYLSELFVEEENVGAQPIAAVVDYFDEDPPLGALFADEEKDDEEVLEYVKLFDGSPVYTIQPAIDPFASPELERAKSSLEELKMPELKPLPPDPLRYEFLYQTNAFPVYLFAGLLGLEVEEPHVKKKKKTGIGVRNREFIFVDHEQPYFQPQRRFIDMKLEVNRKEIIK